MHGLGFAATGKFGPSTPGEEMDHDRMDVLCQVPRIMEYAGLFVVVVDLLVSNACGLGKETRVGVKVKGAGQETALL